VRVAVVGAGLAGLAAARRLTEGGVRVVVYEKSRGVGGRLAARRLEGTVVDHGAPALDAPEGTALAALADAVDRDGLLALDGPRRGDDPPDAPMARPLAHPDGLTRLAKHAAQGVEVVRGVRVATLRPAGGGLELGDEQGNGLGGVDAVVVSAPAPQAADLLERSPEPPARVAALRELAYHPAVMAVLGVPGEPPAWWLARPADGPVAAVSVETAKGRPPVDGVVPYVVRLTPEVSAATLDAASDDEVADLAAAALGDLLGRPAGYTWRQVKRWRYATVAARADWDALNPPGTRVVLCGDAVSPPGMAAVYDSGVRAAERVLALLPAAARA
jgi:predicted NAD/FAD-dependent oxidoreductase